MKLVKRLEKLSDEPSAYIYHTWCKSPLILISERDFIEKRIEIVEDSFAYLFSFSVPKDLLPETKKVIRCTNYINIQIIEEKSDYWLFTNFSQSDLQMPIPENFLNFTLPGKFNSWYEEYVKYFKSQVK